MGDVVAGTGVSAIGNLNDIDSSAGVDGKPITFTGTGATGLSTVNTQGIEFNGIGMTVASCPTCTPFLGSTNVLHLHVGDYMQFPPGTVGLAFTLQDMGTNGFQIKVTNTVGVQSIYSGAAYAPDVAVFSPPSDLAGISRIDIVSVTGTGLFGISEIKTANPGGDPTTIYDTGFGGVTTGTYNNLKVLTGDYSSIGLTSVTPTSGLTVQATFAGDSGYSPSTSSMISYNTITPTFGVGGSEATGVVTNTATPFTSVFCSVLDPDTDRDSLCDSWESTAAGKGIPYTVGVSTFHYPLLVANPNHKDVFVEADAMNGVWSATYQNAINDVVTAFTKAPLTRAIQSQQKNPDGTDGIALHVVTDETGLRKANALKVWTDTDTNKTNDYFTIKGAHFGTPSEYPTLVGTQINGGVNAVPAVSQTTTVSGLTLTTPTLTTTKGDNANSAAQGTITIIQKVSFGAPVTITTPIAAPSVGAITGITWGIPSATILSGARTATQTIAITLPFTTVGPVTANIGTISTPLLLNASTTTISVVTALNSPSVSDTLLQAKAQAFRYALFVDCIISCGAGTNPSGLAEQIGTPKAGNDIMVGLGPESGFTATQNNIAGTFMHELGHTLGLSHGGPQYTYSGSAKTPTPDSNQNCKPNYESIMSYSRQLTNYLGTAWNLNYSSGTFGPLTTTNLSEPAGLVGNPNILATPPTIVFGYNVTGVFKGTTASTVNTGQTNPGIDWNNNGAVSGTVTAKIQNLGITGCTYSALSSPISDYNDWLNLNYNFTSSGSFNGGDPDPVTMAEITQGIDAEQKKQTTFLTVIKKIINDNGGALTISGVTLKINGVHVTNGTANPEKTGTFTISETAIPGYIATFGGACNSAGTVKLANGDNKVCTITNDDQYHYGGILQPIDSNGQSIFKLKSTVPVKFQLTNDQGQPITTAVAKLYVAKITNQVLGSDIEAISTSSADIGNQFRYDGSQYIFNLGTSSMSVGTWQLKIKLDDGSFHTFNISLR